MLAAAGGKSIIVQFVPGSLQHLCDNILIDIPEVCAQLVSKQFMIYCVVGKWNLLYTPYHFDGRYGDELTWERVKRGVFFVVLVVMVVLLFYGREKIEE